jgi:RNA polymerase sigma factor for flagellar operon FliA
MAKRKAEIRRMWKRFRSTDDEDESLRLREELITHYTPLVRYTAERLKGKLPACVDIMEMISAGMVGLINAVDKFEPERGILFETYCSTRIRGAILDDLRASDWVPRLIRNKAHRLDRARLDLAYELGREPDDAELAERMKLSLAEFQELAKEVQVKTQLPLEGAYSDATDDREVQRVDLVPDRSQPDPLETVTLMELREAVARGLSDKERRVVTMYYFDEMTMREIGAVLGISESRVCQIHAAVMGRLRERLAGWQAEREAA